MGRRWGRGLVIAVAAAVVVAAGLTTWLVARGGGGSADARTGSAREPGRRRGHISLRELRREPDIVLVLAGETRADTTASGDLYTVHADGSGLRRIRAWTTYANERDGHVYGTYGARWSPDRRLIALDLSVWFGDPYGQLAVVAPSGRRLHTLGKPSLVGGVSWSRGGAIAYTDGAELRVASPASERTVRLWRPGAIFDQGLSPTGVDWAPSGKRLVVRTTRGLAAVTLAGRRITWLTRSARDVDPHWSPRGGAVAFVRRARCYDEFGCTAPSNVYLVRPDGTGRRALTEHAQADSLFWSPRGRSLLFTDQAPESPDGDVELVVTDGREPRRLASHARALGWSPDGTKILYQRGRALWVMDADGGRPTRLRSLGRDVAVVDADWGA